MKNTNLKSALCMSVLALMLCVAMLVGSTFAWFTDSVETVNCRIQAGNLDVELFYKNSMTEGYEPVQQDTNIFINDTLWEPGHVEVIYLKVANLGSLALKYSLGLNIAKETPGTSVETGEEFQLSDFLEYALLREERRFETGSGELDRNQAIAAAKEANSNQEKPLSGLSVVESDVLNPKDQADSEKTLTLIVYMPETVGNEANYRGQQQPSIDLGINLVASQAAVEYDSFDNTYDEEAKKLVPTKIVYHAEDLAAALTGAATGDIIGIAPGAYDLRKSAQNGIINYENKSIILLALAGEGEKVTITTKFNLYNSAVELHNIHIESAAQGAMIMRESSFKMFGGSITINNETAAISTYTDTKNAKIELYNVKIDSRSASGSEGRPALSVGGDNTYCYLKNCDVFGYSVFSSGNVVIEGGTFRNVKSISAYYESYNTTKDTFDGKQYLNNDEAIAILNDNRVNKNIGDAIRLDNRSGNLQSVVIRDVQFELTDPQAGTNFYLFGIRYLGSEGSTPEFTIQNVDSNTIIGIAP